MNTNKTLLVLPVLLALAACSSDSNFDFDPPQALFNPSPFNPVLPLPNSLLFQGSVDGTLNFPIGAGDDQTLANPRVALNQMDGFSTVAPISTAVSEPLAQESLILGDTVRVFEVQTIGGLAVSGIDAEVTTPGSIVPRAVGEQLVLLPGVPLKPKTDYLVMLTNGITDAGGNALQGSVIYELLKGSTVLTNPSLEPLRQATGSHLAAAQAFAGVAPGTVALSWVFRTQSISDVLQAVKEQSNPGTLNLQPLAAPSNTAQVGGQGKADIYVGTLELPYYQSAPAGPDPTPALTGFWTNQGGNVVGTFNADGNPDYAPVATSTQIVPVIMSVPNGTSMSQGVMPADGWPVTIFQHGITRDRTDLLTIADAMADVGRVVIGIDMPLHGITDASSPFHANQSSSEADGERTFDLDIMVNPLEEGEEPDPNAPASGPDGKIDGSGDYFYNLRSLPTARDNLRQAVADLFVLGASVSGAQVDGLMLNSANMSFYGQSLGGIVGTTMLAFDDRYQAASIVVAGGGIAQLLANSASFGPVINGGLEAIGVETGSADYNSFLLAAQTLVDSGDPINHATTIAQNAPAQLHLIEVIDDAVIPNFVATAPLSGTRPLARLLNAQQTDVSTSENALVRFSEGDHGSILGSPASPAATIEMQTQVALFALAQGAQLTITNADVIAPVEASQ